MRILVHAVLLFCLLFMPWWVGAICIIAACVVVNRFYEAVLYGIAFDALYVSSFGLHGFTLWGTCFAVVVFLIGSFIRVRLSW